MRRKILALAATAVFGISALIGCGSVYTPTGTSLTYEEATTELKSLMTMVDRATVEDPVMDIYTDEISESEALSDISTFPITVQGNGQINLEIVGATEMTAETAPDDWLNVVAEKFNSQRITLDDKTVSITVRQMTSGEVVTYMKAGIYEPNLYIPSAYPWALMLEAYGFDTVELTDRLVGNTAGILMEDGVYNDFVEIYGDCSLTNLIMAAVSGDVVFAYPNPYTSTTGLNGLGAILCSFDPGNPLSENAVTQLRSYQESAPPVAYTTAVLRNQAAKGVIDTMLMEEQAYINTPSLSGYTYIPFGIRHDHPVYTFGYCSQEEQAAAKLFVDFCLEEENQKLATEKGFNRHDDYQTQDPGLDGAGWINAQRVWKENKSGGKPIVAVFVADTSFSMDGMPLNSLKDGLVNTLPYISDENYIGLVSFNSDVTVNLPIAQFDAKHRACFSGEVKNLTPNGNTSTYDAVITGLSMLVEAKKEIGDCKLMLFLLSDGQQNRGYSLDRIIPVVEGLQIPVYTVAYNYSDNGELEQLSGVNEAAALNADSEDIVNLLRNLFNAEM